MRCRLVRILQIPSCVGYLGLDREHKHISSFWSQEESNVWANLPSLEQFHRFKEEEKKKTNRKYYLKEILCTESVLEKLSAWSLRKSVRV